MIGNSTCRLTNRGILDLKHASDSLYPVQLTLLSILVLTVSLKFQTDVRSWLITINKIIMNTVQLTSIMDKISCNTHFLGVLPCEHLTQTPLRRLPSSVIFKTHASNLPGEHWLTIYINEEGVGYFFDSFGNKHDDICFPPIINNFLKLNSRAVQYSAVQVQDFSSDTCGQHCVFFLYHMAKGRNYDYVLKL